MTTATRLEQLILKEISGVDDPANMTPGFAIFKSADGAGDTLAGAIAKAVATVVDESTNVAAEDIAKGMEKALAPYTEVLSTFLTRLESVEKLLTSQARKSLDGQDEVVVKETATPPTLNDTFSHVLKGNVVTLTG